MQSHRPALCLLAIAVLAGRPARAQSAADLLQQAIEQHQNARFEQSLELLNRALSATTDPTLLGRIQLYLGVTHAIMDNEAQARLDFRAALTSDPALTLDGLGLKRSIEELFREVRQQMHGELVVKANRPGLVFVDGKWVGKVPLKVRLTIGPHVVEVRGSDGKPRYSSKVMVAADHRLTIVAKLGGVSPGRRPRPPRAAPRRRLWTWVAAGGAAAALGVAIGLGASADANNSEYWADGTRPERGAELEDPIRSKALGANVMFGVAGALAVTSVLLFFLEGRSSRPDGQAWVAPLGQAPGAMVSVPFP